MLSASLRVRLPIMFPFRLVLKIPVRFCLQHGRGAPSGGRFRHADRPRACPLLPRCPDRRCRRYRRIPSQVPGQPSPLAFSSVFAHDACVRSVFVLFGFQGAPETEVPLRAVRFPFRQAQCITGKTPRSRKKSCERRQAGQGGRRLDIIMYRKNSALLSELRRCAGWKRREIPC